MVEKRIILKARYVWDGLHHSAIPFGAILIENGKIQAVGPAKDILTASHDHCYEWPDATILPGLIDSHTHLSMDGTIANYLDHMSDDVAVLTLRATAMMRKDVKAGITTCRCLGDKEFLDIACRHAVENGEVDGPRVLAATRGIRSPDGHGFVGYPFKGINEIRNAIRENIHRGADLIKIYITGTLKGKGDLPSYLSREEIRLAIEESHAANIPVASHCVGGPGLDWAIEFGLDTVEHAYHIRSDQVEKLLKSGTGLVLTPGAVLSRERVANLPRNLIQGHIDEREMMFRSMALTVSAGIKFAVGTDGLHGELVQDISYLTELGASNIDALKAATIRGAKICGIGNETGSLEAGKRADIIVVKGNPLVTLKDLRNISAVYKSGRLVHSETSDAFTTPNFAHRVQQQ